MDANDPNIWIDHIDKNRLNNKKYNLRLSNWNKNSQNKGKIKTRKCTSDAVGTCFKGNKWVSRIYINSKCAFESINDDEITSICKRDLYILQFLTKEHFTTHFTWTIEEILETLMYFDFSELVTKKLIKTIKYNIEETLETCAAINYENLQNKPRFARKI